MCYILFFCEGAAQRINKHYLRMRWINLISVIIATEFIEESLFDNNSKCEDCECTVVRVFLTYPVTKRCRRCRAMNIPSFGRKKVKKNLRGKGGRKVNPRTYKWGCPPPPPTSEVFLRFSLDGQSVMFSVAVPFSLTRILRQYLW